MSKKAYLILEDGTVFEGKSFGAQGDIVGEVVFSTSMTGYLEALTDPSYFGQILVQTFPLMGNYGDIPSDYESKKSHVSAYIVREWCQEPSNFRCEGTLDAFLKAQNVIGLYGIDTRKLTKIIRDKGVMNGKIVQETLPTDLTEGLSDYAIINAVESVVTKETEGYEADNAKYNVVLMDFGVKASFCKALTDRGCNVTVVPYDTKADDILAMKPDGVVLSNGPGDPAENTEVIAELQKLAKAKIPMFGIALGHQLLALSQGAKTVKLKYGHRGANQPVVDTTSGHVYITAQNHGYSVLSSTLPIFAKANFLNVNDNTCEGVNYTNMPAISVQFYPDTQAGPLNTSFLFDRFVEMMKEDK